MILFTLRCPQDHRFEAWFRDGATYDAQAAAHEIACPACGDTDIVKAPMAPRLSKGLARAEESTARPSAGAAGPLAPTAEGGEMAMMMRKALGELRRHVESTCEHVGERFPEEARRIHYGETEARPIYGEASASDREALAEEGIEVTRIPWLPRGDA